MTRRPFDAVLVVAFGGPEDMGDVRPFVANALRGHRVAPESIEEVAQHYEHVGGVSPLAAITRRQVEGLTHHLASRGLNLPVYLGMRNWQPLLPDTLETMAQNACPAEHATARSIACDVSACRVGWYQAGSAGSPSSGTRLQRILPCRRYMPVR